VASVLNDTWEWLYRAEEARKAAEQLTDPDAKQCMLQLGRYYDGLARAVIAQAKPQEGCALWHIARGTSYRRSAAQWRAACRPHCIARQ
jgi:hypothetical protein